MLIHTLDFMDGKIETDIATQNALVDAEENDNLHQLLIDTTIPDLVATASGDHATATVQSPADNVWWLHGHQGPRLRLAELPYDDDTTEDT